MITRVRDVAREHVRALELAAGDRVLVDDHPGTWIVVTRGGDPGFIVDIDVRDEESRRTLSLHVFADQGFERLR